MMAWSREANQGGAV